MAPTITVDGDEIIDASIDGDAVEEITIDGDLAWAAAVGLDGLTVTRQDGSYTASSGEHVVSNGGTITLPSPVQDGIVMITKVQTTPELIGSVDGITDPSILGDDSVVFVSEGSAWYSVDRNQISAIPDSTVDNFEDADADPPGIYGSNEDIEDYYPNKNGDSYHTRTTTNVLQGSQAVEYVSGSAITETNWSLPGDGLNTYPSDGDLVGFLIRSGSSTAYGVGLMVEDSTTPGAYFFEHNADNGLIRINKVNDLSLSNITNDQSQLSRTNVSLNTDWYWAEAQLPSSSDDTITFEIYNVDNDLNKGSLVASTSANDSSFVGSSGVAFSEFTGGGGGETFADWIRIL